MTLVSSLARAIVSKPETVAGSILLLSLLLSGLAFLPDYTIDVGLQAFEIQNQDVGLRQLAGDRFDDWALDSVSEVTCFDIGNCSWVHHDPISACARNRWQRSECCQTCVDLQQATDRDEPRPRVPVLGAWHSDAFVAPSSLHGGTQQNSYHEPSRGKSRTLDLVIETQDGSSIFSTPHFDLLQKLEATVLSLPSFLSACDATRQLDDGDGSGNKDQTDTNPLVHSDNHTAHSANGCVGSSGALFQNTRTPGADATANFYADQIWEGKFDLIMKGIVDKYFSSCNLTSTATTLIFHLYSDGSDAGEKNYEKFMAEFIEMAAAQPYLDSDQVLLAWYESDNDHYVFLGTLMSDKNWAAGAVVFVFLLIWAQTQSLLIACAAFTHILLSIPVSQFFFGIVLGIDWISFLQALPLFIIMGIGADDVFVFMDAWRRSIVDRPELADPERQEERLVLVMENSVNSMFITSVTTATSFAAICLSSVAPLRTLGIYAGLVVMLNFVLCSTWFPAIVVVSTQRGFYRNDDKVLADLAATSKGGAGGGRAVELWFQQYTTRLGDTATRRLVLVSFSLVTGIALILTAQLAMPTAMPELFPPDSNVARYKAADTDLFSFEKYPVSSDMVWGINAEKSTNTGRRSFGIAPVDETKMVPVYDQSIALDSEASQAAIAMTCRALIGAKTLVRGDVDCPMLKLKQWLETQGKSFPVPSTDFAVEYGNFLRDGNQNYRSNTLFDESTGRLLGMRGSFESVLDTNNKNSEVMDIMERTSKWFKTNDPTHASSVFHTNSMEYRSATLNRISYSGMVSLFAQLGLSLVVLLLATKNYVVALLCFTSICANTLWSLGFMYTVGWSFGILESICVTILVGLVVDYVVHMGMSYLEAPASGRRARTEYATVHMGVSICSGAVSTTGASAFLTCCTITFFPKFGIFMAVTIAGSFICAGVVLPAALLELGPEDGEGGLHELLCCWQRRTQMNPESKEMLTLKLPAENSGEAKGSSDATSADIDVSISPFDSDTPLRYDGGEISVLDKVLERWQWVCWGILLVCALLSYVTCPPGQTFCSAPPPETKELTLEMRMPGFQVPSPQTTYECHGFDFPQDETYHITSFKPIQGESARRGVLHHMILYKAFVPASKCFRECIDMPSDSQLVWAWAVGMDSFPMPPNVGYPVGKFSDTTYTSLQIHYNNVDHQEFVDDSGVTMHMTTKLREFNMGILSLGRAPGAKAALVVPPNTRYEAIVTCKPSLVMPIKVFAYALHAHLIGKQIWAEQLRNGTIIRELGRSNRYDFSKQRFRALEEHYEVLPGDTLRVHCVFDSSCPANATAHGACGARRVNNTVGGWATENEMCFNFLAFYPAENAENEFCTLGTIQSTDPPKPTGTGGAPASASWQSQVGIPDRVCRGSCVANQPWGMGAAAAVPLQVGDDEQYNAMWHDGCHCENVTTEMAKGWSAGL